MPWTHGPDREMTERSDAKNTCFHILVAPQSHIVTSDSVGTGKIPLLRLHVAVGSRDLVVLYL